MNSAYDLGIVSESDSLSATDSTIEFGLLFAIG